MIVRTSPEKRESQTCVPLFGPQELRGNVQRIVKRLSIPDPECGTIKVGEAPLKKFLSTSVERKDWQKTITLWKLVQKE